jgi:hypothetical protein
MATTAQAESLGHGYLEPDFMLFTVLPRKDPLP